jgi:hydantoinase/carbamoylase family amidase
MRADTGTRQPEDAVRVPVADVEPRSLERLIARFAAISASGEGVTRLAYSRLEREAHAIFAEEMEQLGLRVTTDAVGNSIAELVGSVPGLSALGTGSHLDSVPNGGRFDGVAGVCAAIEVARVVVERGVQPRHPWRFVAFAAEEGARFGQACNGSRVIAGLTTADDLSGLVDADGVSMAAAMASVGLRPDDAASARWTPDEWLAFVELHIEQGNLLETQQAPIGIVDVISGSSRLLVHLKGTASHTGGTPMHLRHDALAAASECVLACERLATDARHHGTRVTVGRLDVAPDSITTIPGEVTFSVDVRDVDSQRQRESAVQLTAEFEEICGRRGVALEVRVIGDTSPVVLPVNLVTELTQAAREEGLEYRVMPSGASHDAQQISRVTKAGMIFVPSRHGGVSHVPEEWTTPGDLARGTRVLLAALSRLDAPLGEES